MERSDENFLWFHCMLYSLSIREGGREGRADGHGKWKACRDEAGRVANASGGMIRRWSDMNFECGSRERYWARGSSLRIHESPHPYAVNTEGGLAVKIDWIISGNVIYAQTLMNSMLICVVFELLQPFDFFRFLESNDIVKSTRKFPRNRLRSARSSSFARETTWRLLLTFPFAQIQCLIIRLVWFWEKRFSKRKEKLYYFFTEQPLAVSSWHHQESIYCAPSSTCNYRMNVTQLPHRPLMVHCNEAELLGLYFSA